MGLAGIRATRLLGRAFVATVSVVLGLGMMVWPSSGAAEPPVNVTPPTVSGSAVYGSVLTADPGEWSPAEVTVTYQWLADGSPIPGAVGAQINLGLDELGRSISVSVTGTDPVGGGQATAVSAEVGPVARAVRLQTQRPVLTGSSRLGRTLEAEGGKWSPAPDKRRYQWYRGKRAIEGADGRRYRVTYLDVGKPITVHVRVTGPGYVPLESVSEPVRGKHRVAVRRVATYSIQTRGRVTADLGVFAKRAAETYADPRGWRGRGVKFRKVAVGGDFTLVLAEASTLPSFSSACSSEWSCRVGRFVVINQTRWLHASPAWKDLGAALRDYRHMVVNHETGHWLGFGHAYCPAPGRKAPVMQQQSKGLQGCRANPWPTQGELGPASARLTLAGLGTTSAE